MKKSGLSTKLIKSHLVSKSEFVWAIGDDDLLTLDSLETIQKLLKKMMM